MLDIRRNPLFVLCGLLLVGLFIAAGCSSDEDPASPAVDTVPPAIPDGLAAWNVETQGVTLTWSANVSDPDLAGYLVYRAEAASGPYRPVQDHPVTSNSWTDPHTEPGGFYHYRVSARDTSRNESALSVAYSIRIPDEPRRDDDPIGN